MTLYYLKFRSVLAFRIQLPVLLENNLKVELTTALLYIGRSKIQSMKKLNLFVELCNTNVSLQTLICQI